MKNIKKLFLGVFLLMGVFALTGCGTKTAISAETYKTKMEAKKYTVQDATSQFSTNEEIKKVYLALSSDSTYQIEFYELDSVDSAVSFYNNNKTIFEQSKSNASGETDVSGKNNAKYTLSTNGQYKVLSRIDSTVIYINAPSKNKDEIKKVLKELGY